MAAATTIAALLVVLVAVAVAADDILPSRPQMRRWVRECHKDSAVAKSKPLYAFKKSIAGLYDPRTRHAFRKTKVTFAKFEFATIRRPTEAEKCLMECLAEKQGMINGTQLQAGKIVDIMMALGKRINDMHGRARVNMTQLKRNTAKCIVGTHGSAKSCELGFRLFHCLRAAVMESIYEAPRTTTPFPYTTTPFPYTTSTTPWSAVTNAVPTSDPVPQPEMPPPMPLRRPHRYMMPPPPRMGRPAPFVAPSTMSSPMMGPQMMGPQMMGPPMMGPPMMGPPMMGPPMMGPPLMGSPAPGMSPALVAYRQGSGMVQVYENGQSPWRSHWRSMQGPQHFGPHYGPHYAPHYGYHGPHHGPPRMMGPMV